MGFGGTFIFNPYNIRSIAIFAVAPLLLATGQTFVIISGGIDLSMGFIMGLAAVVAAHVINATSLVFGLAGGVMCGFTSAVLIACIPGIINGLLVSRLKVPPFIGTLGMFGVARNVAFLLAGGTTVPIHNGFFAVIGNGRVFGVPYIMFITAIFMLGMHYLLSRDQIRPTPATPSAPTPQAARRAGIDVKSHLFRLYVLSAACAGFGGACSTPRVSALAPRKPASRCFSTASPRW